MKTIPGMTEETYMNAENGKKYLREKVQLLPHVREAR